MEDRDCSSPCSQGGLETSRVSSDFLIYWLPSRSRLSLTTTMQSDSSSLPILPKNMETQGGSAGPASQLGNVGASFKSPPRVEVPARSEGLVHFSVELVMVPPRVEWLLS